MSLTNSFTGESSSTFLRVRAAQALSRAIPPGEPIAQCPEAFLFREGEKGASSMDRPWAKKKSERGPLASTELRPAEVEIVCIVSRYSGV